MERLLVDASVARSTFYAHFDDKLDALHVVGRQAINIVVEESAGWWTLGVEAHREDLREALSRMVRAYHQRGPVLAAMAEAATTDHRARAEMRRLLHPARVALTEHAHSLQAQGALRQDVNVPVAMGWILAMFEHGLYRYIRRTDEPELDEHIDALTDVVWLSLYASAPNRS